MTPSRRNFLGSSMMAVGTGIVSEVYGDAGPEFECLDYGRSFLCHTAAFNAVRFWVESRTTLFDEQASTQLVIYQCGSCKSEHTFAGKDLFQQDNYDFMPIYGGDDLLILRRHVDARDRYRELAKVVDFWGKPRYKLVPGKTIRRLTGWESIREATDAAVPIVAQTEIHNAESGMRAIIEYPVKTMNIDVNNRIYQVDTGPIAFPDLSRRFDPPVDCVKLAFVAFNALDFSDFVVEQPTPVVRENAEICHVYHYSNPFSLPANNTLLAVGDPV